MLRWVSSESAIRLEPASGTEGRPVLSSGGGSQDWLMKHRLIVALALALVAVTAGIRAGAPPRKACACGSRSRLPRALNRSQARVRGDRAPSRRWDGICAHAGGATRRRAAAGGGPLQQAGQTGAPLFCVNVENLKPGAVAEIDGTEFGHPVTSLDAIPNGDRPGSAVRQRVHEVRARRRPHGLAAHGPVGRPELETLAGQHLRRCRPRSRSTRAPAAPIRLVADKVIPPIGAPADTAHGEAHQDPEPDPVASGGARPIYLGATVLLPKDYDKPSRREVPRELRAGTLLAPRARRLRHGRDFDTFWLAPTTRRA